MLRCYVKPETEKQLKHSIETQQTDTPHPQQHLHRTYVASRTTPLRYPDEKILERTSITRIDERTDIIHGERSPARGGCTKERTEDVRHQSAPKPLSKSKHNDTSNRESTVLACGKQQRESFLRITCLMWGHRINYSTRHATAQRRMMRKI